MAPGACVAGGRGVDAERAHAGAARCGGSSGTGLGEAYGGFAGRVLRGLLSGRPRHPDTDQLFIALRTSPFIIHILYILFFIFFIVVC